MIAYKFLNEGRYAPFSGTTWPEPGTWVDAESIDLCRVGIHACRTRDLPYWLRPELWEIELDGELLESDLMVVAPRGRLIRRVDAWNPETAKAFGDSLVAEVRRRAAASPELEPFADDVEQTAAGATVFAAFASARLAEMQDGPAGYDAERERQARWLAENLDLPL